MRWKGDGRIISIFRMLAMEDERFLLQLKITNFQKRQFTRTHKQIVQYLAGKQKMLVPFHEIVADLLHHFVRYHITLFLASVLDTLETLSWIQTDIASLQEILGECLEPCEIIVSGYNSIVPLYKNIIQELAHIVVVPLIAVCDVHSLIMYPVLEDIDLAGVVLQTLLTQVMFIKELLQILSVSEQYICKFRILERLACLYPWVPAIHEFLCETLHQCISIFTLLTLTLDSVKHDSFSSETAKGRVKSGKGDITLRSLMENRRFPSNDTAQNSLV